MLLVACSPRTSSGNGIRLTPISQPMQPCRSGGLGEIPVPLWAYVLKPEHPFFGNSRKLGKGCEACFGKGKAVEVDPGGLLL